MNEYKIYPLINMVLNNEQSMQTYTKNFGKRIDTPIVFFLIQGNGVNILVDSGACDAETATKNHHPCTQTEDMLPANLVRAHGVEPEDSAADGGMSHDCKTFFFVHSRKQCLHDVEAPRAQAGCHPLRSGGCRRPGR